VLDAHSLSFEVLGELGLVGTILLGTGLGILLVGLGRRSTGVERTLYAAALASAIAWLLHAQVDWDWEMPAVTSWLFMIGAAASARERGAEPPSRASPVVLRAVSILAVAAVAAVAGIVAISETDAVRSLDAVEVGDCRAAVDAAESSNSVLAVRVQAYEIKGYCEAAAGRAREAIEAMKTAIERDPDNWEAHYGLAVVQAAAGQGSGQPARDATRLNPREPLAREALELSAAPTARERKRRAQEALLSLGPDGPALLLLDL
jgi:tetratricopeptide (TPR) repeat protein